MTPDPTFAAAIRSCPTIPRLENGDHLTRAEFERRYEAAPNIHAELIEGIVFLRSRVRLHSHGKPHQVLCGWLGHYIALTPGLDDFGDNSTTRLDDDNEPQPDLSLLLPKRVGGLAYVDADGYIAGPPTFVAEIAASTVSIDLHAKLAAYRRTGVREYLVWRTEDAAVDYFALRDGQYVQLPRDGAGVVRSEQFPGLWLDAPPSSASTSPPSSKPSPPAPPPPNTPTSSVTCERPLDHRPSTPAQWRHLHSNYEYGAITMQVGRAPSEPHFLPPDRQALSWPISIKPSGRLQTTSSDSCDEPGIRSGEVADLPSTVLHLPSSVH